MSQAGIITESSSIGSDIKTLTGDAGGAVGADLAYNVDILGIDGIQVGGTPASNLLEVGIPAEITLRPIAAPAHGAGKVFYDTATDSLTFYNSESEVALQIGEENWIKVRNETGVTITNGSIVYLSGTSGGVPLISLAQANAEVTQRMLGVVTHDIENNSNGFVTTFGLVRGLNTGGLLAGDIIYLSPTVAGSVTTTKPTNSNWIVRIGYVAAAAAAPDGTFLVTIENSGNIEDIHGYTNDPNGFEDPTNDVQISFVNGTRTFTIQPVATSFGYWSEGMRYDKTGAENIVISNTEGLHYIYYDGDTLAETTTFSDDIITKYAFAGALYWDAANSQQIYFADEYLHTTKMGSLAHVYLHSTRGFSLQTGGGITDLLTDQSGDLDSHAQFGNELTIAFDEDAEFNHSARTSVSNVTVYYKTNTQAAPYWRIDDTASFGVLTTGTGRAAYNELTGGNWVQTEVSNNNFVLAHVFTYNDSTRKFAVIQGENEYANVAAARDGAEVEIAAIVLDGLPSAEFKFIGTIIYQTSDGYGNTVKSRTRTVNVAGDDYIDLRDFGITRGGVSGTLTDHGVLTGLGDDDHTQYFLGDGTRTLTGTFTHQGIAAGYTNAENIQKQAGVQTTDGAATAIDTIALATNTMVTVEARFNGFKSDFSESCGGFLKYTARRAGAGAVEVAAPIVDIQEDAVGSPVVDADVNGNNVRLLVTGVNPDTWNWTVTYNYHFTQTNS
jgi:hypothetical protein